MYLKRHTLLRNMKQKPYSTYIHKSLFTNWNNLVNFTGKRIQRGTLNRIIAYNTYQLDLPKSSSFRVAFIKKYNRKTNTHKKIFFFKKQITKKKFFFLQEKHSIHNHHLLSFCHSWHKTLYFFFTQHKSVVMTHWIKKTTTQHTWITEPQQNTTHVDRS